MLKVPGKARGVLRQAPTPGAFHHGRYLPEPALASWIEHFWSVAWDLRGLPTQRAQTLPHPNVHLVFEQDRTAVFGVHGARFERVLEGHGRVFGVKFRAGGFRPFLGRSVATIADASLTLREVFGAAAEGLETQVLGAADDAAMQSIASTFLLAHQPPHDANVERVATIVAGIVDDRCLTSVEDLAQRHALTTRTLQRLFQNYVGVGAKWVINRYRLHEAIEQLEHGAPLDWRRLALDLGYSDQSHFIRDFKQLIGRAPGDYVRTTMA